MIFFNSVFGSVPFALHRPHKKTYQQQTWLLCVFALSYAESFFLCLLHWEMLNIAVLFRNFGFQCQASCSTAGTLYLSQMMRFKSPCFSVCTPFSLSLAVCTAPTFGAVTIDKLRLGTVVMANLGSSSITGHPS